MTRYIIFMVYLRVFRKMNSSSLTVKNSGVENFGNPKNLLSVNSSRCVPVPKNGWLRKSHSFVTGTGTDSTGKPRPFFLRTASRLKKPQSSYFNSASLVCRQLRQRRCISMKCLPGYSLRHNWKCALCGRENRKGEDPCLHDHKKLFGQHELLCLACWQKVEDMWRTYLLSKKK